MRPLARVRAALLQSLEPTGVGARDLAECLTLQLRALRALGDGAGDRDHRSASSHLALLARRDLKRLMRRDRRRRGAAARGAWR